LKDLSITQLKILIFECLEAQKELAKFLNYCAKKYEPILSEEEAMKGLKLMERVSITVDRVVEVIDEPIFDRRDKKLPERADLPKNWRSLALINRVVSTWRKEYTPLSVYSASTDSCG